MRIPSGKIDQKVAFYAENVSGGPKTGLSSFTVYRSRNGGTATIYTTPTVAELSSANMPGWYVLTVDEDTTVESTSDSEEYLVCITATGMQPVAVSIELYRRDTTSGQTVDVATGGVEVGTLQSAALVAIEDQIWDALRADHVVSSSMGESAGAGQVSIYASTVDIQGRLPAALVSGRIDASVGAMASGVLTDTAIAADAITAAKVAADVTTEIQAGLATAAALAVVDDFLDTEIGAIQTALTTIDDFLDTEVAAILADTDELQTDWVNGGRLDLLVDAIKAKTDALPSDPADASVIAGRFDTLDTSVADLPTNAELATSQGTADDATLAAIAALSIPTAAVIADAVWDEDATAHQTLGTFGQAIGDPVADTDTIWALVNANLNATVSSRASQTSVDDLPTNAELATALGTADDAVLAQVALVKAQTDLIPSDPADASVIAARFDTLDTAIDSLPTNAELATSQASADDATLAAIAALNNLSSAQVGTAVDTALATYDGPTNAELATALGTADDATLAAIAAVDGKINTIDDFLDTEIGAIVTATGAAAIRTAVGLASANLDTQLGDLPTNAELATSQGTADDATLAAIAALVIPTAANNADAVWDEAIAGHVGVGSTGEALTAAGSAGDPWTTALPGAYGAGSAGQIIGDNINATISSRASQAGVDDLPTNAELATALGTADDAVLTAIGDLPTNAELATALGTADDAILTQVALVKAKTDSLTFTTANVLDAHVKYVAGEQVVGAGTEADPWSPA